VLNNEPNPIQRVLAALSSKRADARASAALWLAGSQDPSARPALHEAWKERNDAAKQAMVEALEALGVPLERILDVDEIAREAETQVADSNVSTELSWFPLDGLPRVHWKADGRPVTQQTVLWWLLQARRLKTPEPLGSLRRQMGLVEEVERGLLGAAVLQAWIDFDTMPRTIEEARMAAGKQHALLEHAVDYLNKMEDRHLIVPSVAELTEQHDSRCRS
jgi:hypothetical protein